MIRRATRVIGLIGIGLVSVNAVGAPRGSGVEINGQMLSSAEWVSVQTRLNTRIAPGRYLVDPHSGCWLNIKTGRTGCIGDPGLYPPRHSNGEIHQNAERGNSSDISSPTISVTGDSIDRTPNW